jgi:hypothetical protein
MEIHQGQLGRLGPRAETVIEVAADTGSGMQGVMGDLLCLSRPSRPP